MSETVLKPLTPQYPATQFMISKAKSGIIIVSNALTKIKTRLANGIEI